MSNHHRSEVSTREAPADQAKQWTIAALLAGAEAGDQDALTAIWSEYSPRLNLKFRKCLRNRPCSGIDEEDLTLDVLDHVCRQARSGAYHGITTHHAFWNMTAQVAENTLVDRRRHERRQKRGGRSLVIDMLFDLEAIPARPQSEGDDDDGVEKEFYEFLRLEHFRQPLFWPVVMLRLDGGMSVEQVAEALHRTRQAIHAQLQLMRTLWEEYVSMSEEGKRARADLEEVRRWKRYCEARAQCRRGIESRPAVDSNKR